MIYSVVPEELADELYGKLVKYYKDDPEVSVIVDRRKGDRRAQGGGPGAEVQRRGRRDRRRQRLPGEFPPVGPT